MLSSLPLSLALLSVSQHVVAAPNSIKSTAPSAIQLTRRLPSPRTDEEWGIWAKAHKERVMHKYGAGGDVQKRATGTNLLVNQNADSSFFGSLAIGTPPVAYNVILDTGSADLWVADSDCITGCSSVPTFDTKASTSFVASNTSFKITYGSGEASGTLAQDTVQMAGFSIPNQIFAVCDKVSDGLLTNPVSGLLGLAFSTIASSGATPFWETLAENGAWDSPLMAFQLTRFGNVSDATTLELGGSFTMGSTNSSLYTGDIDYVDIPSGQETYWIIPMTAMTVQGSAITLPSGSDSYSAIDTGTTLVGGPAETIAAMFAQIPNSVRASGNFEGYWAYPCDTQVSVTLSFGGSKTWSISPADFLLTQLSTSMCIGAFFELSTGSSAPAWIVGDVFLKNVYSVFRFDPPSVGFAQLSDVALALNGADNTVPTQTLGSASVSVFATNTVRNGGESGGSAVSGADSRSDVGALAAKLVFVVMLVVASCSL